MNSKETLVNKTQRIRWFHPTIKNTFLVEEAPQRRLVFRRATRYSQVLGSDGQKVRQMGTHEIPIPWMYYLMTLTESKLKSDDGKTFYHATINRMAFRPTRLSKIEDRLYRPCLPNIYAHGAPCMGPIARAETKGRAVQEAVDTWWCGPMNNDMFPSNLPLMTSIANKAGKPCPRTPAAFFNLWEKLSLEDMEELDYGDLYATRGFLALTNSRTKVGSFRRNTKEFASA